MVFMATMATMPTMPMIAKALRRLAAGVLLATPLACLQIGSGLDASRTELAVAGMVLECPVGSEGCPCTSGGGCDPGLVCISGFCSYGDEPISGDYEFDEDLAEGELILMEQAPARSSGRGDRFERKQRSRDARNPRNQGPAPAPVAAESASDMVDSTGGTDGMAEPAAPVTDPAAPAEGRRQVIYTAGLEVSVYERDSAIEFAEDLAERWGGWIESRYDYTITLRIPADRLFEAIDAFSELGVVLGKTLRADDVTAEYVDLEARILVLEQIVAQLEALLARATSVEQALEIRVELDRVRIELEAARARMRQLSESIDFSTLTIYFSQRGPDFEVPSSNDPFPWVDELGLESTEYR